MIEDDYDGYFDIVSVREHLDETYADLIDEVGKVGMSTDLYNRGVSLHPQIFSEVNWRKVTIEPSKQQANVAIESYMSNLLLFVSVVESNGVITIGGIRARLLFKWITNHWHTTRITSNIFTRATMREMSFKSFFAVEVAYIIKQLMLTSGATKELADVHKLLMSETWLRKTQQGLKVPMNMNRLNEMNVSLLPSQLEFINAYRDNVASYALNGYLLAAPPGTGKTIAGYALSMVLETDTTIIICPNNSLNEVWVNTLLTRFKVPPTYWASTSKTPPTGKERFIICHYEMMKQLVSAYPTLASRKVNIWLDESHNLNELKSARTNLFIDMVRQTKAMSTVWASGTPLKAMGREIVPLLRTIDPLFTSFVEGRFLKVFGSSTLIATDIVSHRLGNIMYSIPKADVVSNEVEVFDHPVVIPDSKPFTLDSIRDDTRKYVGERVMYYREAMPKYVHAYNTHCNAHRDALVKPEDIAAYVAYRKKTDELHNHFNPFADRDKVIQCKQYETANITPKLSGAAKEDFRKSASVYKYVALTIRGEALGRVLTRRRIDCFVAMVNHSNLEEIVKSAIKKTLIFTSYVEVAEAISKRLKKLGFNPLMVHGDHNKNLVSIMNTFKTDPKANPLIATYDSLSTAVPVIEASTCVLFNAPFRDYTRKQATSRVDRLGQDSPVTIINITLDTGEVENISTRSSEIMEWSKEMVDALLGLGGDISED